MTTMYINMAFNNGTLRKAVRLYLFNPKQCTVYDRHKIFEVKDLHRTIMTYL